MALTVHKIGPFDFISLRGEMVPPRQMVRLDDRPGVDGTEKILSGNKGEPFTLHSLVDAESYESGVDYLPQYQTLIDGDAVEVIKGGVSTDSQGYRVLVLAVRPNQPRGVYAIRTAVGNRLYANSQAMVEAIWDLIAVPLES